MASQERPCLRPGLAAVPDERDDRYVYLWDSFRLSDQQQRLSVLEFSWLEWFNGRLTVREIQLEAMRKFNGKLLPLEWFTRLIARLDEALFLDGPRYHERLASPIREPTCIGCYEGEAGALRKQLKGFFTSSQGPGLPSSETPDGRLRAALIPHIDYQRGGPTFAWGFKEVFERSDASLFVIIGTAHYSPHRFTLTRKDFKTPLGIARTEQRYIDRLVAHYGDGLFDDELAHLPEHSIELEVVFLQYLYENRRDFRIVPLLAGPFQDCIEEKNAPSDAADIRRMIAALQRVEAEITEPICYLISGDLAHIGPKFGDPYPVDDAFLNHSRQQDQALLQAAEKIDVGGYFGIIAGERDRRRICGLPPTYTLLEAVRPRAGQLLHYDQYVHPRGFESVSFASMAFYR